MVCKLCGRTDHVRASSSRCLNRVLRQRDRFVKRKDDVYEDETYTIKMGLRKFVPSQKLRQRIEADVLEISALMEEASLYWNYRYLKLLHSGQPIGVYTHNHLLDVYYHLQGKQQRKERLIRDNEYFQMRPNPDQRYDGKHRSYTIQNAAKQHETAMKNCILVHLYARVCKYFSYRWRECAEHREWKLIVYSELFDRDFVGPVRYETYEFWRTFNFEYGKKLSKYDKDWWSLVPFSFTLGKYFAKEGIRSFNLFPTFSSQRKHVLYNTTAFYELLRACELPLSCGGDPVTFRQRSPEYWWTHCNLAKSTRYGALSYDENMTPIIDQRSKTRFGMAFSTNGVDCSISMVRRVPKVGSSGGDGSAKKKQRYDLTEGQNIQFTRFIGIDPGVINCVGACILDTTSNVEINSLLRSSTYKQLYCNERSRKRKLVRLDGHLQEVERAYRAGRKMSCKISATIQECREFLRYRLLFFEQRAAIYRGKRNYCRWAKWDSYIRHRQADDLLVDHYIPSNDHKQCTLVCIGNGTLEPGISYGGQKKPAVERLKKAFRQRKCNVVDVDEYLTTRMCSECNTTKMKSGKEIEYNNVKSIKRPRRVKYERFLICSNCEIVWNRDVNAARNIVFVALKIVNYRDPNSIIDVSKRDRLVSPSESRTICSEFVTLRHRSSDLW